MKASLTLIGALLMGALPAAAATPAGETLFPKTTLMFVSAPNLDEVEAAFSHTQFHAMTQYDAFQPFRDELERWKKDVQGTALVENIPASWEEIRDLAAGETAAGLIPTKTAGKYATVVTIDVGTDPAIGETFLTKVDGRQKFYKRSPLKASFPGGRAVAYAVPATKTTPAGESVAVLKGQLLILANSLEATQGVFARIDAAKGDSLADSPVYKTTLGKASAVHTDAPTHVRYFAVPLPLAAALEQMQAASENKKYEKSRTLALLEKHGFTGLDGVGGVVSISHNDFDLFYRAYVHIANRSKGLKLLEFVASENHAAPAWVPASAASFSSISWDLLTAWKNLGPVFDDFTGEKQPGAFNDIVTSMRDDPDGPRVDLEKEIVGKLTGKVSVLADAPQPASSDRRAVVALETKVEAEVKASLNRLLKNDESYKRRVIAGHEVWESQTQQNSTMPKPAVCVALGSLLHATHVELLEELLKNPDAPKLVDEAAYKHASERLQSVRTGPPGFTMTSRLRDEVKSVYEAFRAGDPKKGGSFAGYLINNLLTAKTKSGQPLNLKLLPEYSAVQDALGTTASAATVEPEGWLFVGFVVPNKK